MKVVKLLIISLILFLLIGCNKKDDKDDPVPGSRCVTNVTGCDDPNLPYSCPEAVHCFDTQQRCEDSGECDGADTNTDTDTDTDTDSGCTTNVEGCPSASQYSCPDAAICYGSRAACDDSGECD
jgi:hypothetical protein